MLVQLDRQKDDRQYTATGTGLPLNAATTKSLSPVVAVLGPVGRVAGLPGHLPAGWSLRRARDLDDVRPDEIVLMTDAREDDVATARAVLPRPYPDRDAGRRPRAGRTGRRGADRRRRRLRPGRAARHPGQPPGRVPPPATRRPLVEPAERGRRGRPGRRWRGRRPPTAPRRFVVGSRGGSDVAPPARSHACPLMVLPRLPRLCPAGIGRGGGHGAERRVRPRRPGRSARRDRGATRQPAAGSRCTARAASASPRCSTRWPGRAARGELVAAAAARAPSERCRTPGSPIWSPNSRRTRPPPCLPPSVRPWPRSARACRRGSARPRWPAGWCCR